jgi:hypothetical protein
MQAREGTHPANPRARLSDPWVKQLRALGAMTDGLLPEGAVSADLRRWGIREQASTGWQAHQESKLLAEFSRLAKILLGVCFLMRLPQQAAERAAVHGVAAQPLAHVGVRAVQEWLP